MLEQQMARLAASSSSRKTGQLPPQSTQPHETVNAIYLRSGTSYDGPSMTLDNEVVVKKPKFGGNDKKKANEEPLVRDRVPFSHRFLWHKRNNKLGTKESNEVIVEKEVSPNAKEGDAFSYKVDAPIEDIIRMYNRKSVSPRFLLKVDLKKAYDSVSWSFLEEMMNALNFPGQFIGLVMESVRTATYSLVLNGDMFGFFQGKKQLRQGDPLSPLLFTIAMEYLSRVLTYVTDTMKFKYHPLCASLKLSHLMFADDLLLFSKGDVGFIMVLLRAFATFSKASGLLMSPSKNSAYFNGVDAGVKQDILQVAGFSEGSLPFSYLGVPITAGRMKKAEGQILVEKLISRIRSFGSKKLSYAGRLVLVNSVLTALYNYWVNIFIIPKGVLNRLNAICRSYLWDGSSELLRVPLVSWEKVCAPRTEGGLGIRDSCSWNVAAMVCRVRDKLSAGYQDGQWMLDTKGYTVSSGYELVRNKFQAVSWDKFVWSDWNVPKHSFVGWLIAREALQVKAKLFALGISQDDHCLICGSAGETHDHLFQQCSYSQRVLKMIADDVQVVLPAGALFAGIWSQVKSGVQQKVVMCAVMAAVYSIWMQRNRVRVEGSLLRPEVLIHQIRQLLKYRIKARLTHVYDRRDVDWLSRVSFLN
ncbi:uncharacterized protein LOC141588123 [Silene latifolia]|uniref:uncharacterized protein LOC141588123 n=1 Tax=Silene latifolia TaxID=37657 RepID=UPI003D76AAC2